MKKVGVEPELRGEHVADTNLTINVQLEPLLVTELNLEQTCSVPVDGSLAAFL